MASMEMRRSMSFLGAVVAWCVVATVIMCSTGVGAQGSLASKCSQEVQKVTACLSFASGKSAAPSKECCSAVSDIRSTDPACLCFIIQQTHQGSDQIKSLGIQESKLLQLPSACDLKNSSVADCPKLLGIPPSSPDYAIFTNASTSAPATGTSSPATTTTSSNDSGVMATRGPQLPISLMIAVVVFLISTFPIIGSSASNNLGSW